MAFETFTSLDFDESLKAFGKTLAQFEADAAALDQLLRLHGNVRYVLMLLATYQACLSDQTGERIVLEMKSDAEHQGATHAHW